MSTGPDLLAPSLAETAQLLARRQVSAVELVQAALDRSADVQPHLNCYLDVYADQALAEARVAEAAFAAGDVRSPLHGIPYAPKDIFTEPGVRCTAGSRILAAWIPKREATVLARLRAAGAIRIGRTNLHEFAYGITNVNPHYGSVHNPWQLGRVPGGSSGGSAAAVAAGAAGFSLGTDTGGSVRLPAALCGIVGLKPTYGLVSRAGLLPLAWSLDHIGPMTLTVADAALVLETIAGHDPSDPTSSQMPVPAYASSLDGNLDELRLGVPQEFGWDEVNPEIHGLAQAAISMLGSLGPSVEQVTVAMLGDAGPVFDPIIRSEATTAHLKWLRSSLDEYGEDVRERLELGLAIPATAYIAAQRARTVVGEQVDAVWGQVDLLALPTVPVPAPRIDEGTVSVLPGEPPTDVRRVLTRLTNPFNLLGLPAISVPCGFTSQGVPAGLQLVGPPFAEERLLQVAHAYEQAAGWHKTRPPEPTA
ncbi:MAG: Asp-tRNA(Asn)/Glu-tRNA(Gln) amidotransferase GatCAB subunit A [Dehalococcoidia bacterium]|nr:Asp-tRNA(Asn)/Glu-tRNA(Gln) amidotransferase GatCAB subunit A [Dehalococcoidia bacterium]